MDLSQLDGQIILRHCKGLALGPHLKTGGQKRVWQCAYQGKAYVLKAMMGNERTLRRVRREIGIMSQCDSPYLPKFGPLPLQELMLSTGETVLYFLEEYIDGIPLGSVHFPMAPHQVVALGACVAEALCSLSSMGYVHRDVKPMNIMQLTSSTYVLIDAGLALDLDGEAITAPGSLPVGTPLYFSPEQITMPPKALDVRSDLFSLGVTMYECATGEHPFLNDELPRASVLYNILHITCKHPHDFVPAVPTTLCDVIMTLLQKQRDRRYHDARELRDALLNLQ